MGDNMADDNKVLIGDRLIQILNLRNLAILAGSLLIVLIFITTLLAELGIGSGSIHSGTGTTAALFGALIACALLAWLSPDNTGLIGAGIRHMLTIHRAAVGSFMLACAAVVLILLCVVVTAASSQDLRHGLYLLAAVEFLLKLAAVSAIIVLITMRRATIVPGRPNPPDDAANPVVAIDDTDNRGQLEFGGVAFAFGLVVIAGLVIPNEELMRLTSMFFGGEKKVEDYLPRQPILTLEDDLGERIVMNVAQSALTARLYDGLDTAQRNDLQNAIRVAAQSAMYDSAIENARRTGTLPILESICAGTHEDIMFANSTNTTLADHLNYLMSEGLIRITYDDLTSVQVTDFGNDVMVKHTKADCFGHSHLQEAAPDTTRALTANSETLLTIDETLRSFRLDLPAGDYHATLIANDGSDPILQLADSTGTILQQDDDSGPGFGALLYFTVSESGDGLQLRTRNLGNLAGSATLYLRSADQPLPFAAFQPPTTIALSAEELARTAAAISLPADGELPGLPVPTDGLVVSIDGLSQGSYEISVLNTGEEAADLVATLFKRGENGLLQVAYDDDGGLSSMPLIRTNLEADSRYLLVIQHFESGSAEATVDLSVAVHAEPAGEPEPAEPVSPSLPDAAAPAENLDSADTQVGAPQPATDSAGSPPGP